MASNINADGIDPNFPVAGVNNSTQGFRDNFFNIKNNLNYAKSEITDLQNKAILKASLNGQKLTNDLSETVIAYATLKSTGTQISDLGSRSGSAVLDFKISTHYFLNTTGPISLTFKNWPTSGICGSIRLTMTVTSTAHTLTLPGTVSRGINNISGLICRTINGLIVTPATTITSIPDATTLVVSATQTVGSSSSPASFTATSTSGNIAKFKGYIVGVTLRLTSAIAGVVDVGMTLSESGAVGASVISFTAPGDYVFDFETIDNGTTILIMDQSRTTGAGSVSSSASSLFPADANRLGGVIIKPTSGLNVTLAGELSTKIASRTSLGAIKVGEGLTIASDGTLSTSGSSSATDSATSGLQVWARFAPTAAAENFTVPPGVTKLRVSISAGAKFYPGGITGISSGGGQLLSSINTTPFTWQYPPTAEGFITVSPGDVIPFNVGAAGPKGTVEAVGGDTNFGTYLKVAGNGTQTGSSVSPVAVGMVNNLATVNDAASKAARDANPYAGYIIVEYYTSGSNSTGLTVPVLPQSLGAVGSYYLTDGTKPNELGLYPQTQNPASLRGQPIPGSTLTPKPGTWISAGGTESTVTAPNYGNTNADVSSGLLTTVISTRLWYRSA